MNEDNILLQKEQIYTFFSQKETILYTQPITEIQVNIEKDLAENPNDIKNLLILAQIQQNYNANEKESLLIYKKILQLDPKNVDARIDLISILTNRQNYEDCKILLNECFEIDQQYWRVYYSQSVYYLLQNQKILAKQIIQNAYIMFPNEPHIIVLFAQLLSEYPSQEKRTKKLLQRVIEMDKLDYVIAQRLANSFSKTQTKDEEKKYLLLALRLNPNSQKGNNNLGSYYRTFENDHDKCLYYCEKAIKLDPYYNVAYVNLLSSSLMKNKFEESLYYLDKSYELNKNNAKILEVITKKCRHGLKNYDKTNLLINKLIKRDPYNFFALTCLFLQAQIQNVSPFNSKDIEYYEQILYKFINKEKQQNPITTQIYKGISNIINQQLKSLNII